MRRAVVIAAVALGCGGAIATAFVLAGDTTRVAPAVPAAGIVRAPALPYRVAVPDDPLVREVREVLDGGYFRPLGAEVLELETVEQMIRALDDPNTEYLSPEEYKSLRARTARSYSGVGLTVGPAEGGLIVTSALRGPAREAGIRKGDVIVRIDGRPANALTFEQSLTLIKGEQGSLVRLTVRRPDEGVIRFTVIRQEIARPALRWRVIRTHGTTIGYLRLLSFPANAGERLEEATGRLVARGARGLVLDLRGNPGGLLAQAVRTVSVFLGNGVVCTVEGAHQDRRVYEVAGPATFPKIPLVVLVDRGSASAAEIVAAALGDHRRAKIVGERTYGKTSVQSVALLANGAALKLTTATYRTPAGRDLVGLGLDPHVKRVDDPFTRPDEAVVAAEEVLLERLAELARQSVK